MKVAAIFYVLVASIASVNAVAVNEYPNTVRAPIEARCHCDGHCCGGSWCTDYEVGPCCDGVPC
ncbi:hypothetical protein LX32DRAFT_696181 [Colletotrichum zoysiae]|uniref:Uncharacterized protein n=1 Tax=Colletotrichum zoysiae TaxID=1216348 RepID=A0AAD9HAY0_9PEZI|nr:hypothetical protein LX32DRAFT_696181 [Colletotrichum zoysiae]